MNSIETNGFIPYGIALGHVLRANPGMIEAKARARLLKVWETGQVKVVSAKSQTHQDNPRQARWLNANEDLLRRSWWLMVDLERAFPIPAVLVPEPSSPGAKRQGGRPALPLGLLIPEMRRLAAARKLRGRLRSRRRSGERGHRRARSAVQEGVVLPGGERCGRRRAGPWSAISAPARR